MVTLTLYLFFPLDTLLMIEQWCTHIHQCRDSQLSYRHSKGLSVVRKKDCLINSISIRHKTARVPSSRWITYGSPETHLNNEYPGRRALWKDLGTAWWQVPFMFWWVPPSFGLEKCCFLSSSPQPVPVIQVRYSRAQRLKWIHHIFVINGCHFYFFPSEAADEIRESLKFSAHRGSCLIWRFFFCPCCNIVTKRWQTWYAY